MGKLLAVTLLLALPAAAQTTTDIADADYWSDSSDLTILMVYDTDTVKLDNVDWVKLKDGKLIVQRQVGMYCGGFTTCLVNHEPGYNHCSPIREVYAAKDGKVVLEKTIEPKIEPAKTREITWPEGDK